METLRPNWDTILCMIVIIISLLATCLRLKVGGLIWDSVTKRIVAIGYNGAPRGMPHCIDDGCEMEDGHCVRCLHCEDNLTIWAGTQADGCHMFLTHSPCRRCCNKIIQCGIKEVVYVQAYGDPGPSHKLLADAGVRLRWIGTNTLVSGLLTFLKGTGILKT